MKKRLLAITFSILVALPVPAPAYAMQQTDIAVSAEKQAVKLEKVNGLKIGGRAADALRLNWSKNSQASGYIIEQYKGSSWTRIAKITDNATLTYRISNLSPYTTYRFRIRGYLNNGNNPIYSNYTAVSGTTAPGSVTGLKVGGNTTDSIQLNWDRNVKANGYIVDINRNGVWNRVARIASNTTVSYQVSGLDPQTTYQFRVRTFGFDAKTPVYSTWKKISATTSTVARVSLSKCTVASIPAATYNGSAYRPDPVLKYGNTTLVKGRDYTVSYSNNTNIGPGSVTFTGIGNYTGSVTRTYEINPPKTRITGITSQANGIKVSLTAVSGGSSYQVQIQRAGQKAVNYNTPTPSKLISDLTEGGKYTVKARAYKNVNNKSYYSDWTEIKTASFPYGQAAANYACKFVGNRYVWGGESLTNGADCSGFVKAVYAHYGKTLPHSSYMLRDVGRSVTRANIQPGDIVCYSGHVAIYIGNGKIVHAANESTGITISSNYAYTQILAIRRLF